MARSSQGARHVDADLLGHTHASRSAIGRCDHQYYDTAQVASIAIAEIPPMLRRPPMQVSSQSPRTATSHVSTNDAAFSLGRSSSSVDALRVGNTPRLR
mmetsp:Transcript_25422/g.77138  ORF Transcript_25422/g.77138 Transcript_25422/m.77138 type:complete len:99 (-) Transcript_25422:241-537(-)|eukprot:scaffold101896_cov32-Tisochrysis_lutea.AAC.1